MKFAPRPLLLACTLLLACGTVPAADAPKAEPAKPDAAKADAAKTEAPKDGAAKDAAKPAEPDLPSKPYPKHAAPKAFAPKKGEQLAAKDAARPAEKAAEPHAEAGKDHHADAHDAAAKGMEKGADKAAEKSVSHAPDPLPSPRRAPRPQRQMVGPAPKPVADPAMSAVAGDYLRHGAPGGTYRVRPGENLDTVIRKSMPNSPFSPAVMREAFVRANPELVSARALRLKPGATVHLPDAAVLRQVVLGQAATPEPHAHAPAQGAVTAAVPAAAISVTPAALPGSQPGTTSGTTAAMPPIADATPAARAPIAVPPLRPDTASTGPAQPVPPEEKKKWVHFP